MHEALSGPSKKEDISRILRGADREIGKILRAVHKQGFIVTTTNSNHFKISTPEHYRVQKSQFAPKTPSDARSLHRVRSKLRKIGVDI
jgi:hypothetical protein